MKYNPKRVIFFYVLEKIILIVTKYINNEMNSMYRSKDFILMDVVDIKGKKIGFVKDIIINFNSAEVEGFIVSSYKFFKNTVNVYVEDIISYSNIMVVKKTCENKVLKFSDIKNIDIIDRDAVVLGMLEDILFDKASFEIKAIIVSTGLLQNLISGKKVFLMKELLLGEEGILKINPVSNMEFSSVPHRLLMEVDCNEKENH